MISAIEQVAKSNFSVVIVGETGSGKEVVARAIHQASGRKGHPFVPVDCGAVPETLIESELFGHERGAFTGADQQTVGKIEAAHTGTLFLDEISNMPLASQAKLLRVLQERTLCRLGGAKPIHVDVRMLTASGQDLEGLCESGGIPSRPLLPVERIHDLHPAAARAKGGHIVLGEAVPRYCKHRASQVHQGFFPVGDRGDVGVPVARKCAAASVGCPPRRTDGRRCHYRRAPRLETRGACAPAGQRTGASRGLCDLSLRETVRSNTVHVERIAIVHALRRTGGNKAKAARLLQVDYKTLHSKVKEYGIQIQIEGEQPHD